MKTNCMSYRKALYHIENLYMVEFPSTLFVSLDIKMKEQSVDNMMK